MPADRAGTGTIASQRQHLVLRRPTPTARVSVGFDDLRIGALNRTFASV
jgi:hypothetical protein